MSTNLDSRNKCLYIFLDLSNAFDTAFVPKLTTRLDLLDVRGIPFNILKNRIYNLNNHTQSIKMDTYFSDEVLMTYGVPQGSILGPHIISNICQ